MPSSSNTSSGGNAQIKKQGHTSIGKFGDDPDMTVKGSRNPRDLNVKAK